MGQKKSEVSSGDLAIHSRRRHGKEESSAEKVGLVLKINPTLGSGFKSAEVMWCDSGNIETVMINYLQTVQKL
tara:strand:- start:259 stop:477 length:219 start_codon:yes stop_codon:yes gene_type:complete